MLCVVLDRAWRKPFSIKSTFARNYATTVAVAASSSLITVYIGDGECGNTWQITEDGRDAKDEIDEILGYVIGHTDTTD